MNFNFQNFKNIITLYCFYVIKNNVHVSLSGTHLSSLSIIRKAVTMSVGSLRTELSALCIITHICFPKDSDNCTTSLKYFSKV
jgi:hypothetical protein